jgi:hypothetical protein
MFNGFKKLLIKGYFNSSALNKVNIIKRKKEKRRRGVKGLAPKKL